MSLLITYIIIGVLFFGLTIGWFIFDNKIRGNHHIWAAILTATVVGLLWIVFLVGLIIASITYWNKIRKSARDVENQIDDYNDNIRNNSK